MEKMILAGGASVGTTVTAVVAVAIAGLAPGLTTVLVGVREGREGSARKPARAPCLLVEVGGIAIAPSDLALEVEEEVGWMGDAATRLDGLVPPGLVLHSGHVRLSEALDPAAFFPAGGTGAVLVEVPVPGV